MAIAIPAQSVDSTYLTFSDPVPNNVQPGSEFHRILYSPPYYTMAGLMVAVNNDSHAIPALIAIENDILDLVCVEGRQRVTRIADQFGDAGGGLGGVVGVRISGVYSNMTEFGLTLRVVDISGFDPLAVCRKARQRDVAHYHEDDVHRSEEDTDGRRRRGLRGRGSARPCAILCKEL